MTTGPSDPVVAARDVVFAYAGGPTVLAIDAFEVAAGEKVFVRGPSGSGKSTLLGLIAGVLTPQSGAVTVSGVDFAQAGGAKRDALRAERLGVIFQMFNLLPFLSVVENVALPCKFSRARRTRATQTGKTLEDEARRLLDRLGLAADLHARRASDLSVGQQQRVAAARALIGAPALVIADEPTSALDADTRDAFVDLLIEESAQNAAALIFVSHDASLARHFDRTVDLPALNRAAPAKAAA